MPGGQQGADVSGQEPPVTDSDAPGSAGDVHLACRMPVPRPLGDGRAVHAEQPGHFHGREILRVALSHTPIITYATFTGNGQLTGYWTDQPAFPAPDPDGTSTWGPPDPGMNSRGNVDAIPDGVPVTAMGRCSGVATVG